MRLFAIVLASTFHLLGGKDRCLPRQDGALTPGFFGIGAERHRATFLVGDLI